MNVLHRFYRITFKLIWRNKVTSLVVAGFTIPFGIALLFILPKEIFPRIDRIESLVNINWNEPINLRVNNDRVLLFIEENKSFFKEIESEVGQQQFLYSSESYSEQQAQLYIKYKNGDQKVSGDFHLKTYLKKKYPNANIQFGNAPNAFEQLFATNTPMLEARFRQRNKKNAFSPETADSLFSTLSQIDSLKPLKGFNRETTAHLVVDEIKARYYGINLSDIFLRLKTSFGPTRISTLDGLSVPTALVLNTEDANLSQVLLSTRVETTSGTSYAIREFVHVKFQENYSCVTSDESGRFQSIEINSEKFEKTRNAIDSIARNFNSTTTFDGRYIAAERNKTQLFIIVCVSISLMFLILTAEFESFRQPLIVIASLPLGITGSLMLLWMSGGTLNVMSGIGLVVVLGILDNDAILKIDRINTLSKIMPLEEAIHKAGEDRLRPIVMNTLTNILAITPILWSTGLGSNLQTPVVLTTIGGLIFSTIAALYFVPLMYWYFSGAPRTSKLK